MRQVLLYGMVKISFCIFSSGGYVNPAVTLGMMIAGKLHIVTGLCYILMHILGAISGAGLVSVSERTN